MLSLNISSENFSNFANLFITDRHILTVEYLHDILKMHCKNPPNVSISILSFLSLDTLQINKIITLELAYKTAKTILCK